MSEARAEACLDLRFSVKEFKLMLSLAKSLPARYFYIQAREGKTYYTTMNTQLTALLHLDLQHNAEAELPEPSGYLTPSEALKALRKLKDGFITYRARLGKGGSLIYNGLPQYAEPERDDVEENTFIPRYSDCIHFKMGAERLVKALSLIEDAVVVLSGGEGGVSVGPLEGKPFLLREAPTEAFVGYYDKGSLYGPLSHIAKLSKTALDVRVTERCVLIFECAGFRKIAYHVAPHTVENRPRVFKGASLGP